MCGEKITMEIKNGSKTKIRWQIPYVPDGRFAHERTPHPNPLPVRRGEGEDVRVYGSNARNRSGILSPSDGEREKRRQLVGSIPLSLRVGILFTLRAVGRAQRNSASLRRRLPGEVEI